MISNSQLRSEARTSLGNGKWGIAIGGFLIYFIITQAIGLIPIIGPIGNILLGGPFAVGLMYFYLKISRDEQVEIEDLFIAFKNKNQFLASLVAFLLIIALVVPTLIVSLIIWIFLIIGKDSIEKFFESIGEFTGNLNAFNIQTELLLYEPNVIDSISNDQNWMVIILGFILVVLIPMIYISLSLSQIFFIIADDENISGLEAFKKSWILMKNQKLNLFLLQLSFIGWVFLSILTIFIGFIFLNPYIYTSYAKFFDNLK